MTQIFNFALKIKGGGREGARCEVSKTFTHLDFGTCTWFEYRIADKYLQYTINVAFLVLISFVFDAVQT